MSKWDQRYIEMAQQVSRWSKDPSTKIGAVAVDSKKRILSTGYNGFPRGIEDTPERWNDREVKYKLVVHAEMNMIYNASYNGVSLDGSTLYVYGLPCCSDCARGIIQVGVKRVVMPTMDIPEKWLQSWNLTKEMFNEAGVQYEFLDLDRGDQPVER